MDASSIQLHEGCSWIVLMDADENEISSKLQLSEAFFGVRRILFVWNGCSQLRLYWGQI